MENEIESDKWMENQAVIGTLYSLWVNVGIIGFTMYKLPVMISHEKTLVLQHGTVRFALHCRWKEFLLWFFLQSMCDCVTCIILKPYNSYLA